MSAQHNPGPASNRFDPMLTKARKRIEAAIAEHCGGSDLESVAADAARDILGEILQQAHNRFTGVEFDPTNWRRMPPALRAAIAKATGAV